MHRIKKKKTWKIAISFPTAESNSTMFTQMKLVKNKVNNTVLNFLNMGYSLRWDSGYFFFFFLSENLFSVL